ncbi:MAG: toll/interleukin-1 receptor domain-containing protein [Phycisphaerales bacterium]
MTTTRGTVFISYAHESDVHVKRVWDLAEWLGGRGWTVVYDRPFIDTPPPKGWSAWMRSGIMSADCVLVVCTAKLKERYQKESPPDEGRGARYEGAIVTRLLYESLDRNTKFYPIVPDGGHPGDVPIDLQDWDNNHRFPSQNERIEKLLDGAKRAASLRRASSGDAAPESAVASTFTTEEGSDTTSSGSGPLPTMAAVRSDQARATRDYLAKQDARMLLDELVGQLQIPPNQAPIALANVVVDRLSKPPEPTPGLSHLYLVTRAVAAIDRTNVLPAQRAAIEEAAVALFLLRALHLVNRAEADAKAAGTSGPSPRVPLDAPMLCAVVAAELFGGKIVVERLSGSKAIMPKNIHLIRPPKAGRLTFNALAREVYAAEFPHAPGTTTGTLDATPLSEDEWDVLNARIAMRRGALGECFAIVVPSESDAGEAALLSTKTTVPVFFGVGGNDGAAKALFHVSPGLLDKYFTEFCGHLFS